MLKWFISKEYNNKKYSKQDMHEIYLDHIKNNITSVLLILFVIAMFELSLIIRSIIKVNLERPDLLYRFVSYIALFLASMAGIIAMDNLRKNENEKTVKIALRYSYMYVFVIALWAVVMSAVDMPVGGSAIVFLTVFSILPIFFMVSPKYVIGLEVIFGIFLILHNRTIDRLHTEVGFEINMMVFIVTDAIGIIRVNYIMCSNYIMRKELKDQSVIDALTGLGNRRALDIKAEAIQETAHPCTIVMLDVDDFKTINDTYGHNVGDESLAVIGSELESYFGHDDVFRYGGDEFTIITEKTAAETATLLELLNEKFAENDSKMKIRISAGVCAYNYKIRGKDNFANVDNALYQAKRNGKSQVKIYKM